MASDDNTGNRSAGGDWVMEDDDIDISADYFDAEALKAYTGICCSKYSMWAVLLAISKGVNVKDHRF